MQLQINTRRISVEEEEEKKIHSYVIIYFRKKKKKIIFNFKLLGIETNK